MIGITIAYAQRPTCATSLLCYRQLANVAETQTINSLDQHAVLWTRPTKISCRVTTSLQPKFYHPGKFGEGGSGRFSDNWPDRNRLKITRWINKKRKENGEHTVCRFAAVSPACRRYRSIVARPAVSNSVVQWANDAGSATSPAYVGS